MPSGTGFDSSLVAPCIRFEDVCSSSITVVVWNKDPSMVKVSGYTLWYCKADEADCPMEPACTLFEPNTRFSLSGLTPATIYHVKVVYFDKNKELKTCEVQTKICSDGVPELKDRHERSHSPAENFCSLSNPSSVEDESNNVISCTNEDESEKNAYVPYCKPNNENKSKNEDESEVNACSEGINCIATGQNEPQKDLGSMLDEGHTNYSMPTFVNLEENHSPEGLTTEEASPENGSNTPVQGTIEGVPFVHVSTAGKPNTPCKLETLKGRLVRSVRHKPRRNIDDGSGSFGKEDPQDGGSVKQSSAERQGEKCSENDGKDFGYYVKVIRWLECDGNIETSFRQKFLTWYSLGAAPDEVRVVKVFVDTLVEDPASLVGQLIDTFSEVISSKCPCVVPTGFCLKLWH